MTTGKTVALTIQTFVGKVMSLLCNMLSTFVIDFLPRSEHLLISWLQSPSAVILEPKKINLSLFPLFPLPYFNGWLLHFQDKPFNITVIQVYAPTSNSEEAEVERFYEDL